MVIPNLPAKPLAWSVLAIACLYLVHFGLLGFLVGPYDFNHLSTYYELAWRFWHESPGLPHFNPYFCGGRTLGGDPQIPIFHPLVLLVPILGPALILKWEMLAQLCLGTLGLWNWLKRWQVPPEGRLWGCLLFIGGGFTVGHFMVGHVTLGFYTLLPLYFWLSYQLCERRHLWRDPRAIALVILFVYCGLYKPNFFIYALPPLFFEAVARSVFTRRLSPLILLIALTLASALAAAMTLLPASRYFASFPRISDAGLKSVPLSSLFASLLVPLKALPASWYGTDFMQRHEYSIFIGPVGLVFVLLGLRRIEGLPAEKAALLAYAFFCGWLGLGSSHHGFSIVSPYSWLNSVWPGFYSVRVPVRFWHGVFLAMIVFSAQGFRWPKSRVQRTCLFILGIAPILVQSTVNLTKTSWFSSQAQWNPRRVYTYEILQAHANPDAPYSVIRQGFGVIECADNLEAQRSNALQEGPLLALKSDPPGPFSARWLRWNRLQIKGQAVSPTRINLNMNHHAYWKVVSGDATVVSRPFETLALSAKGAFNAELVYEQPMVGWGLILSVVSFLALLGGGVWLWKRRRPLSVGLTGGIASGKSVVAQKLKSQGLWVVDLDERARELTNTDPQVQEQLRRLFGPDIFDGQSLNRRALRERVFSDSAKRTELERLLHPRLMQFYEDEVTRARSQKVRAVFCEAALLVETGLRKKMDFLVLVTAPPSQRRERLKERDKMREQEIDAILAIQAPDAVKSTHADLVLHNSKDPAHLDREIAELRTRLAI